MSHYRLNRGTKWGGPSLLCRSSPPTLSLDLASFFLGTFDIVTQIAVKRQLLCHKPGSNLQHKFLTAFSGGTSGVTGVSSQTTQEHPQHTKTPSFSYLKNSECEHTPTTLRDTC